MHDYTLLLASTSATVSGFDIINLFAAAASIILAIVALALSIFFFVQSKDAADQASKSAEEISASVSRLEKIFDSLYSDTFGIMRETVTDMRRHIWKMAPASSGSDAEHINPESQRSSSEAAVLQELDRVSRNVGLTDAKVSELTEQLAPVINRALEEGQRSLVQSIVNGQRTFRENVLELIRRQEMTVNDLIRELKMSEEAVVDLVFDLAGLGFLTWEGAPRSLGTDVPLRIK